MRSAAIDREPSLREFDLLAFNGGVEPWPAPYIFRGFGSDAERFRSQLDADGFHGLGEVADIGCGFGRWSLFLAEANSALVGYDRNEKALDLARRLCARFEIENARFETADVAAIPAADASFGGVWCSDLLSFVDRRETLTEFNRLLRIGGRLGLMHYYGAGVLLERMARGLAEGGVKHNAAQFALRALRQGPQADGRDNFGSAETIEEVLNRFGFELAAPPRIVGRVPGKSYDKVSPEAAEALKRLVERIEEDPSVAEAFVADPQLAEEFPRSMNIVAVKRGDPI